MSEETLVEQITGLIARQVEILADMGAEYDAISRLRSDVDVMARRTASRLVSDDEHRVASQILDLVTLAWGDAEPEHSWWRTPLGRIAAASVGRDGSEAVSAAVAGQILGISRQAVNELARRGRLDRHPDGGVTRASVMGRVAEREDILGISPDGI